MPEYQRFALILDLEGAEFGQAAVRLLELGVDVLYANDLDEASLLARQEAERLGAVLVSSRLGMERLDAVLERVCAPLAAKARALVPVGPEPEPGMREELAARGVRWRLWEPWDDRDLRFVACAAMATQHDEERRKDPRIPIPTRIETAVFMGRHRKDVVVHDLSMGGAYLAAEKPFLEGSALSLDIPLSTGALVGKGRVVSAKTPDVRGRPAMPEGMGIAFTYLTPDSEMALHAALREALARFQLEDGGDGLEGSGKS